MLNFKFVISAIPVGHGGAGDYLNYIIQTHKEYNTLVPFLPPLRKHGLIYNMLYGMQIIVIKLMTWVLVKFSLVDSVVIHHPQTLGYKLATSIIKGANKIDYWVVDTSFFCKQSYNYHNGKACFQCVQSFTPYPNCKIFPWARTDKKYLDFQNAVSENLNKITFHVQTSGYDDLLKYRYGREINVDHNKMLVPEFYNVMPYAVLDYDYEIGFHGNLITAKGFSYVLDLSSNLINIKFFMPGDRPKNSNSTPNVFYKSCTWFSGLDKRLAKCKIILCPSIWTAPIEAAVIKSMLIGRPVGLINSRYNFSCEMPQDCYVSLTGVAEQDSVLLKSLLVDHNSLDEIGLKGQAWARRYIKNSSGASSIGKKDMM